MTGNASIPHQLMGYWNNLMWYWNVFDTYNRKFKNPIATLNMIRRDRFPVRLEFKNGRTMTANSHFETGAISKGYEDLFEIDGELVIIVREDMPPVRFHKGGVNGDLMTVFLEDEYDLLDVKDRVVIDVGANIGDSPIYFALRGAREVIALEPVPENFEIARKNIAENRQAVGDRIRLVQAGCSGNGGRIRAVRSQEGPRSILSGDDRGDEVDLTTIEDLVKDIKDDDMVLKMDCEGCEYDSVLNCPDTTLRRFRQIFIEYHYGYRNLEAKLRGCGFDVRVTAPTYARVRGQSNMLVGNLYATRADPAQATQAPEAGSVNTK